MFCLIPAIPAATTPPAMTTIWTNSEGGRASPFVTSTDGTNNQLAFMVQSTPLHALEELGKHNEVMPQKSTYFFPKLATGMMMYPLK